jgi:cell shape-determining protein MreC
MEKRTVTLREEQVRELEDSDTDSFSEAVRLMVDRGLGYEQLETENQRLRNEKQTILNQRKENQELVEYMKKERELQIQERERRQQPVWVRLRQWVFGHK